MGHREMMVVVVVVVVAGGALLERARHGVMEQWSPKYMLLKSEGHGEKSCGQYVQLRMYSGIGFERTELQRRRQHDQHPTQ